MLIPLVPLTVELLPITETEFAVTVFLLPTIRTEFKAPVIVLSLPNAPLLRASIVPLLLPTLYVPVPLIVVGSPIAPEPCPVTTFPVPILIVSFAVA